MDSLQAPKGFKILTEGKANILYHEKEDKKGKTEEKKEKPKVIRERGKKMNKEEKNENRNAVFYNPVQEFNRDLSILWITEFGDGLRKVSKIKRIYKNSEFRKERQLKKDGLE